MATAEENSFENIFNSACSRLKSNGEVETTSKFFSALCTDVERYDFVESLFEKLELYCDKSTETEKSATKSCVLREEGNDKFKRKHDLQALTLYTQSILFAPPDSTTLALAYGNRSAVLKSLNKFEDCIKDIERAMTLKFPENLVYKLLVRQGECLKAVGKMEKAIKMFLKAQEKLKVAGLNEERSTEQMKLITSMILKCTNCKTTLGEEVRNRMNTPKLSYSLNEEITCASSCVRIEYSPYIGRHLCATQDIMPGSLIIINCVQFYFTFKVN
jgi:SET and MYND domain-containing protein 4